jgi:hypothetical protein
MSRLIKVVMVAVLMVAGTLSLRAWAGEHDMSKMPQKEMPAEFLKMKSLVGTWTGKANMGGDKDEDVKVTYELTAGGSAIMEKLSPGTPHEMVTMYNVEDGKLRMKHYCMLGNAPVMSLQKATDNELSFEVKGKSGLSSGKEMHMHGLDITWKDDNHIAAKWTSYNDGKQAQCSVFNLTRKM